MRPSDLLAGSRILRGAFVVGLSPYIYPNGFTNEDLLHSLRENIQSLTKKASHSDDEAGSRVMVAYDTDAAPLDSDYDYDFPEDLAECRIGDGERQRIVGVGNWVLQPKHRSQKQIDDENSEPSAFGPSANKELLRVFVAALAASQAKHIGGDPYVYLKVLAVDPEYQRKGVGTKLLAYGLDLADKLELPAFLEGSPHGKALYNRVGFEDRGWVENFDVRDFGSEKEIKHMCMLRPAKVNEKLSA